MDSTNTTTNSYRGKSVSIYLLKPTRIYTAGETIYGKVEVTSDRVREIKKLVINVEGTGSVGWTETIRVKQDTFRKVVRYGEEIYLNQTVILLNKVSEAQPTIPEGRSCYSFSYKLPYNIPSTFSTSHAQIRYRMQAKILRPMFKSTVESKHVIFSVKGVLNLNKDLKNLKYHAMTVRKSKNSCCLWSWRKLGPIGIEARIKRRAFVPGESIAFSAFIINNNARRCLKVTAYLVQYTTYKASYAERTAKSNISIKSGPIVQSESSLDWDGLMEIPVPTLCTMLGSTKCKVIQIRYRLVIRLDSRGKKKLKAEFPIYIGTGTGLEDQSATNNSSEHPRLNSFSHEAEEAIGFSNPSYQPVDTYVSIEVPDRSSSLNPSPRTETIAMSNLIKPQVQTNNLRTPSVSGGLSSLSLSARNSISSPSPSTSRNFLDPMEIEFRIDAPPSYEDVIRSSTTNPAFENNML